METVVREPFDSDQFDPELHPVLKRIYAARGLQNDADIRLLLEELEPPGSLLNIDVAVSLLSDALSRQDSILVVGDFDADGATSCALALLCLRQMGFQHVDYLVPNRFDYGYGLTPEIVEVACRQKPDLIITVDNGIASHDGINSARDQGIQVLVTDHHLPAQSLPAADCILNPNQGGCTFPSKNLAGVGVVFYLLMALRKHLREQGWFAQSGFDEPNLARYLDLVALGTVADVVRLDQNNRRMVKFGLEVIRSGRGRPGIRALLECASRNWRSVVAADLGFAAGPRLNAAGRLEDMSLGIECLLAEDPSIAGELAGRLDSLNGERRQIESEMHQQALELLGKIPSSRESDQLGLCLYDSSWHQGVVGILASRLKERFHRPVIVFADAGGDENGMLKGSARSISGLHIRDVLDRVATNNPEVLHRFGGHAMAAGLTIQRDKFNDFSLAFQQALEDMVDPEILEPVMQTDGELTSECLDLDFARLLREAGPWGRAFPEPLFEGEFAVISQRLIGTRHLKLLLEIPGGDGMIDAIAFNVEPERWQQPLNSIRVAYRLDVNEYRGTLSPQLIIESILGDN